MDQRDGTGRQEGMDEEIGFLDLAIVVAKHKKKIFGIPFAVAVVTAIISLFLPNIYTGRAIILPPQQQLSSLSAQLMGQIGGLGAALLGAKSPEDVYVGMLRSQTVADNLIRRFKLQELYEKSSLVETRAELAANTSIVALGGLIYIDFDDKDPKRAAEIANAYLEELDKLNQRIAVTEAGQRRIYFERQLKQVKNDLAAAEIELKKTQEATGIIKLDEQGKAIIEAVAFLRAQIAAKEVQLGAMRSFATENNPDYIRNLKELEGLRAQLVKLERSDTGGQGDIFVATEKMPEAGLEYLRKYREVKYQEGMYELLTKQYEVAKLEEAKDAGLVQVVDRAVPPDYKSKPRRSLIVIVAALCAGILVLMWAFAVEALERIAITDASRFAMLKGYLRRGRRE